jgi:propionyl-CoA carboxylase alpha chain
VSIDGGQFPVMIKPVDNGYNIRHGSNRITISSNWNIGSPLITAVINGQKVNIKVERIVTGYRFTYSGISVETYVRSPRMSELESLMIKRDDIEGMLELLAPLSGQIVGISVAVGDLVVPGQELIVLTAMKMENIITAERAGKIGKINVVPLENVSGGQLLIEFE